MNQSFSSPVIEAFENMKSNFSKETSKAGFCRNVDYSYSNLKPEDKSKLFQTFNLLKSQPLYSDFSCGIARVKALEFLCICGKLFFIDANKDLNEQKYLVELLLKHLDQFYFDLKILPAVRQLNGTLNIAYLEQAAKASDIIFSTCSDLIENHENLEKNSHNTKFLKSFTEILVKILNAYFGSIEHLINSHIRTFSKKPAARCTLSMSNHFSQKYLNHFVSTYLTNICCVQRILEAESAGKDMETCIKIDVLKFMRIRTKKSYESLFIILLRKIMETDDDCFCVFMSIIMKLNEEIFVKNYKIKKERVLWVYLLVIKMQPRYTVEMLMSNSSFLQFFMDALNKGKDYYRFVEGEKLKIGNFFKKLLRKLKRFENEFEYDPSPLLRRVEVFAKNIL